MTEKRKRRRFQSNLRRLLIFVLLVSIGMSWLGVIVRNTKREANAAEKLVQLRAYTDRSLTGNITSISFNAESVRFLMPQTDLGFLHDLPKLEDLSFCSCGIDETGLKQVRELTSVRQLTLAYAELVTDEGLKEVGKMSDLRGLDLMMSRSFSDAGLKHLTNLSNLETLFLGGTQITDAGLHHLNGLTNLQELDLGYTEVTPRGIQNLQEALPECVIKYY